MGNSRKCGGWAGWGQGSHQRPCAPACSPAVAAPCSRPQCLPWGAWTWGQGLREAPTGWRRGECSGPRSRGEEASLRALRGVLGGSQDRSVSSSTWFGSLSISQTRVTLKSNSLSKGPPRTREGGGRGGAREAGTSLPSTPRVPSLVQGLRRPLPSPPLHTLSELFLPPSRALLPREESGGPEMAQGVGSVRGNGKGLGRKG